MRKKLYALNEQIVTIRVVIGLMDSSVFDYVYFSEIRMMCGLNLNKNSWKIFVSNHLNVNSINLKMDDWAAGPILLSDAQGK